MTHAVTHPGAGAAATTASPATPTKPRYTEEHFQEKLDKTLKDFHISSSKFDKAKEYIALQFMRDGAAATGIDQADGHKYFDLQYGPDRQRQLIRFIKDSGGRLPSEIYADDSMNHAFVTDSFIQCWADIEANATTSLFMLGIKNKPDLYRLPRNIKKLTGLTELDLSNNALELLPASIGRLVQLTKLNVNQNALQAMPYRFSHLANLKHFEGNNNQFTTVPYYLRRFIHLESLDLSHNKIRRIEAHDFFFKDKSLLKKLDLSHNELYNLSSDTQVHTLTNLTTLNCSHNKIHSVSKNLGKLRALRVCNFSHNHLTHRPEFYIPIPSFNRAHQTPDPKGCTII